jgi:hypothetical protein
VSDWAWVVLIVVVVLIVAAIAAIMARRRRTSRLREGFGPEYDRTVERAGGRSAAESDLIERERRHDEIELRPLGPDQRRRFVDDWQATQAAFVDDPARAIGDADTLIQAAMRERGYPVDDFEERAAIVSVDHPVVVERYRRAHAVAESNETGGASTESLRQAMQDYRELFMHVVEADADSASTSARA